MTPAEAAMRDVQWRDLNSTPVDSDLPYATHEGELYLGNERIRCYRLSNGQAIFHADDFLRVILGTGGEVA
ncbi:hypothetical protein [Burkholderia gladioli]|uniref:hypothetical protein n=1 Tax=Burkholderia gladioli TaxID=28095 RepID=UPI000D00CF94|nr:hypothetical protein [Burkholderia gladioli]PRH37745.1 hypothetical protein C6V07_01535 [Burkholderia gladioli]